MCIILHARPHCGGNVHEPPPLRPHSGGYVKGSGGPLSLRRLRTPSLKDNPPTHRDDRVEPSRLSIYLPPFLPSFFSFFLSSFRLFVLSSEPPMPRGRFTSPLTPNATGGPSGSGSFNTKVQVEDIRINGLT